jgi:hypothetical protein
MLKWMAGLAGALVGGALIASPEFAAQQAPAPAPAQGEQAAYELFLAPRLQDARDAQQAQALLLGTLQDRANPSAPQAAWIDAQQDWARLQGQNVVWTFTGAEDDGIGATLSAVDPALRAQLGLKDGAGVVVAAVVPGGPADRVGLKPNDILLSLDGHDIGEPEHLARYLKDVGDKVATLSIVRTGKPQELKVKARTRVSLAPAEDEAPKYFIGVQANPAGPELRAHLGEAQPEGQGLVIDSIVEDGPAAKAGLKAGDILLEFRGKPLDSVETLAAQVQAAADKAATVKLLRGGQATSLEVTPAPRPASESNAPALLHTYQMMGQQPNALYHYWLGRQLQQADPNNANVAQGLLYLNNAQDALVKLKDVRTAQAVPDDLAKRLEDLDAQLKALRQSVEELRQAQPKR